MEIKITSRSGDQIMKHDGHDFFMIEGGGLVLKFVDGEPEDNTLQRNFSDVFKIDQFIGAAYNAGRMGKKLEIKYVDEED